LVILAGVGELPIAGELGEAERGEAGISLHDLLATGLEQRTIADDAPRPPAARY
jgi:hypothetical protein